MRSQTKSRELNGSTPTTSKRKKIIILGICSLAILLSITASVWYFTKNYAEEAATPFNAALLAKGAIKQCSQGAVGRGPDTNEPWYYAIYEVPGSRDEATKLVREAAHDTGFELTPSAPPNPEDNNFYTDRTSKKSPYSFLEDGNIEVLVDIFGSKTYYGAGSKHCGVIKRDNPPQDKTTVWITTNLPAFK